MKPKTIFVLFILLFAVLFSCKETPELPDVTNKKEPPVVETLDISGITISSAVCGGNVTYDGNCNITARGVCWNTSGNPTLGNCDDFTDNGSGTGSFTSNLTNLQEKTEYYVCAYATNEKGTSYGQIKNFTTLELTLPKVQTSPVINITSTSAQCGGNVTDDGNGNVSAHGVCWNTTGNPTLDNCDSYTEDGSGTGEFTSNITGLTENTTYYVSAYATNEKGTSYGNSRSFYTEEPFVEMITVNGGTFQMGSNEGSGDEQPVHTVTLSTFSISKYEITNSQFCEFLNDIGCDPDGSYQGTEYIDMNDSDCQVDYTGGQFVPENGKDDFPVIEVTWYGAKACCEWAGGRLPTEAEWEFAARGGNNSNGYTYSGSDNLGEVAWYSSNSGGHTHEVGTKDANELGIHDMSGNVWEWCNDWYDSNYYSISPENNPQGPSSGTYKLLRGGSWYGYATYCRVAYRYDYRPINADYNCGFRFVQD